MQSCTTAVVSCSAMIPLIPNIPRIATQHAKAKGARKNEEQNPSSAGLHDASQREANGPHGDGEREALRGRRVARERRAAQRQAHRNAVGAGLAGRVPRRLAHPWSHGRRAAHTTLGGHDHKPRHRAFGNSGPNLLIQ